MTFITLFILAVGLSMDAFAVAICTGLGLNKASLKGAVIVGLYFGLFQAGMPLIGFATATRFAEKIIAFDHWVAFLLLGFLGGKMIYAGLKKDQCCKENTPASDILLKPGHMLPLAVATSIDAAAVGITLAFLQVDIIPAVALIGAVTFIISMFGVKIGSLFGARFKSKAEIAGGCILILMGITILIDHIF